MKKLLAKNIGGVSFILILTKGATLIISVILARHLSKADFGEFTLMRTLILMIPPLAIWGQDIAVTRFFSRNDPSYFRWQQAFLKILAIAVALTMLGIGIAFFIYRLTFSYLLLLFISGMGYCAILLSSNLVRSQKQYYAAIIVDSGFRFVFVALILLAISFNILNKSIAINGYALAFPLFAILGFWYCTKRIPKGTKSVPKIMHIDGLWLMLIEASVVILASTDHLFISGMLSVEALGVYSAVAVPINIFDILVRATKFVLIPELGAQKHVRFKMYNFAIGIVAMSLLAIFVFGGKTILHILYGIKYDEGLAILQVLAGVGVMRLFYSLSSAMIVGRLGQIALKYHTAINICAVIFHIALTYWLLRIFAILGAALAVLVTTLLRVAGSYYVVHQFRYTEKETLVKLNILETDLNGTSTVSA